MARKHPKARQAELKVTMKALVLFLVSSLLAPLACPQGNEPYTIKADALGETLAQYRKNNGDCTAAVLQPDKDRGTMVCHLKNPAFTYAGIAVAEKYVGFLHDRLYVVNLIIPHGSFPTAKGAVTDKFGPPTKTSYRDKSTFITLAEILSGKELTYDQKLNVPEIGEETAWLNGISTITLSEYSPLDGTFKTSSITFSLDDLSKEAGENMDKAIRARNAKAKSDT